MIIVIYQEEEWLCEDNRFFSEISDQTEIRIYREGEEKNVRKGELIDYSVQRNLQALMGM